MHIAPEPSTDVFQAVMAGTEERTIKGAALCMVDELPFTGLGKFGAAFLGKFQVGATDASIQRQLWCLFRSFVPLVVHHFRLCPLFVALRLVVSRARKIDAYFNLPLLSFSFFFFFVFVSGAIEHHLRCCFPPLVLVRPVILGTFFSCLYVLLAFMSGAVR